MTRLAHARLLSVLALAAVAAPLTMTRAAHADECTSDPHTCAVTFFEAGRKLLDGGQWELAAKVFQKSVDAQPTIGAYLNLGDCEGKLGAYGDAYTMYAAAERLATETRDPRRSTAETSAAAIAGRVLRVRLRGEAPSPTVRIDDAKVQDALVPLLQAGRYAVDPSKNHKIDVTAPGAKPYVGTVSGPAGGESVVDIEGPPASATPPTPPPVVPAPPPPSTVPVNEPPPPPPPPASGGGGAMRGAAIGIGAVGIGGIIAGTVAGVVAIGKKNDLSKLCSSYPSGCDPTQRSVILSDNNAAQTAQWVSTIGLIAGAAAVATGVVLYLAAPRAEVTVSPTVGGAGVTFLKAW